MHVVECPFCHRKSRAPRAVANRKIRCANCGQVFVGSSAEVADAPARPEHPMGPRPPGAATPPEDARAGIAPPVAPAAKVRTSTVGVVMLVATFFGVVLIIFMAFLAYWLQTHPVYELRDPGTGAVLERRRVDRAEYDRLVAEQKARQENQKRKQEEALKEQLASLRPGEGSPASGLPVASLPTGASGEPPGTAAVATAPARVPAEDIKPDANLDVSKKIIAGATVGEVACVCGRVLNKYPKPLREVTVKAYVNGVPVAPVKYAYVPAGEEIRYSVSLGAQKVAEEDVQVVAAAEGFEEDLLVWSVPQAEIRRQQGEDRIVWSGWLKNPHTVPVKNVRICFDFFASDGLWVGRASTAIAKNIGAGKSEPFSVDFTENIIADIVVARATAEKY